MMSKIVVVAAAAAGYVLGTRAGREHYEQIKSQAEGLWRNPRVQAKTAQVTNLAKGTAAQAKDQLAGVGKHATDKVRSSSPNNRGRNGPNPTEAS